MLQRGIKIIHGLSWSFFERVHGEARPAHHLVYCAKTAIQSAVMWLIFLFVGPFGVWQMESVLSLQRWRFVFAGQTSMGALLFGAGWALAWFSAYFLVSRGQGTPLPSQAPRCFVVAGPYRYVRNPMAMGSLAQGFAIALLCGSPLVLLYIIIGILLWNYVARPWEEFDLERRFGAPYAHYKNSVRCWVPQLRPYRAPE